ncbi:MAG: membrane protein insertase YidC [Alistipes sp.]|jgi:YidC/Oxa1 family membrane protein insertase|nr:membrane protein insertase YidC [Alistipes sp.]
MNKQTITGLVIIGAILFGFSWYQNSQQKKFDEQKRIEDSIALANAPEPLPPVADTTALVGGGAATATEVADGADGVGYHLGETLGAARVGEPQTFSVENDVATFEFSTLGGAISDVVLKDYKQYGGGDLHLWEPGSQRFDVSLFLRREFRNAQINTRDFNFEPLMASGSEWAEGEESKEVTMRLPVDSLASIEFVYTIPRADYMIDLDVRFVNMEGRLSNQSSFDVDWANTGLQNEKGFSNENTYSTISYHYPDVASIETLGQARAGQTKEESEPNKVQWVAFKGQFFSSILIADEAFQGADMNYATHAEGSGKIKDFHARMSVPMSGDRTDYGFRMYLGPNKFSTLKEYGIAMERLVPLGGSIIGWISRLIVIPLFDWLGAQGLAMWLIILIMTFVIKTLIFPLTFSSYKSSAKMRVIKPEVDEINAKFPDREDAMKKQQATMELYRRAGINPLLGCIPMLIQFPIIIAMFRFFPAAIELRGESLWWAEDLSSYDSVLDLGFNIPFYGDHVSLFALLMAVSTFFYSWLNFKQQAAQPQMAGMKFMMLYAMPVMMLFFLNNYAAGLCFYYLLSNLFTIAQIYGVRMFINEDKLRAKMLSTPTKPKKKSGFMARLEEAQKAQLRQAKSAGPADRSPQVGRKPARKSGGR